LKPRRGALWSRALPQSFDRPHLVDQAGACRACFANRSTDLASPRYPQSRQRSRSLQRTPQPSNPANNPSACSWRLPAQSWLRRSQTPQLSPYSLSKTPRGKRLSFPFRLQPNLDQPADSLGRWCRSHRKRNQQRLGSSR
jgi:hypothetical protein